MSETKAERRASARAAREDAERDEAARATRRRRAQILGGAVLAAIAVAVVLVLVTSGGGAKKAQGTGAGGPVAGQAQTASLLRGIPQKGVTLGDPGAPVKMVEFVDLQCPICREYTEAVLPTVVRDYVRQGKVSVDLRVISILGEDSSAAQTAAAIAARQNRLWTFSEVFYANQGEEGSGYATDAFLDGIAKASRVDRTGSAGDFTGQAESLARRYGVDSTPTVLVGKRGGSMRALVLRSLDPGAVTPALDALAPKT